MAAPTSRHGVKILLANPEPSHMALSGPAAQFGRSFTLLKVTGRAARAA